MVQRRRYLRPVLRRRQKLAKVAEGIQIQVTDGFSKVA